MLPGTPKSNRIKKMVRDRVNLSYRVISQNFPFWDTAEEHYRAYRAVDVDDAESFQLHGVTKIVVPIQFATIQTMLTFMMEVFTAMKPVLRVRGADPRSVRPARLMELLLDYDYRGNRGYYKLYNFFLNMFRYGYGVVHNAWGQKQVLRTTTRRTPGMQFQMDGQSFDMPGPTEVFKDYITSFEGNQLSIVDNRSWFYDTRLPIGSFQEGEFCGRRTFITDNDLRKMEDQGLFFNTTKIRSQSIANIRGGDVEGGPEESRRDRISPEVAFAADLTEAKRNHVHINEEIEIELIPKDAELSDEERPERWLFNVIDGETIVRAEPSEFPAFPYSVCEVFPDALAYMNQGIMEMTEPLAAHLTFLFNSHMANVRKAINDTLLVDPSRVNLQDLLNPSAGKIVRLLPTAYGTAPATAIQQLQINDITRAHTEDAKMILDLWQRIVGTADSMFGQISPSRRTATELQGVLKMSGARMKMIADLASSEGVAPLTEQMAMLRQKETSLSQFYSLAGRTAEELGVDPKEVIDGFLKINPDDLNGVFSFPAEEGVVPADRAQAADLLKEVFKTVAQFPILQQVFDPVEIFRETVRQAGYHGLNDFLQKGLQGNATILQSQQFQDMLGAGKLAPLGGSGGGGNGRTGRPDQGITRANEGLDLAGAIGGAGRTRNGKTTG